MTTKTLLLLAIIVIGYFFGKKALTKLVNKAGRERNISSKRIQYVNSFVSIVWTAIVIITIISLSGIGFNDFGLIIGSAFALLGIALFAQWSILSNITASIIVFFLFPYRVGDYVKIIDGENSIEGVIKEITLFHVILTDIDQTITTYPNSMVFQKAVSINPASTSKAITSDEKK